MQQRCGNLQNHLRIFGVRLCFAFQGVTAEQLKRDALDQVMTLRLSNKVATGLTVKYMLMLFSAPVFVAHEGVTTAASERPIVLLKYDEPPVESPF